MRTFNLLKYLSQHHRITLITQPSEEVTSAEIEGLRQWVEDLVIFPQPSESKAQKGVLGKLQRFGTFLQQGTPPHVLHLYSEAIQEWVDAAVSAGKYDVITCEHSVNEIYVRSEWQQQLRTVVNIHSSVYATCKHQLETGTSENWLRDQLNLPLLRRYEERYCAKFSGLVVTTAEDKRQLQVCNPTTEMAVIPNGVDLTEFPQRPTDPGGHRLVFIGAMDNAPNIDAVRFFSLEIFPEIQQLYPDVTLELVGSRPGSEVLELAKRPGITVTGRVPSMVKYLHTNTVCIVPMRTGFGIKNKTLEAMAAGTPVVGSDRGLEGLTVEGASVPLRALRANTPAEYVYAISRLFEEAKLREQISRNAREMIENEFTWERAGQLYEQILTKKA